jgi:hypothetical protein
MRTAIPFRAAGAAVEAAGEAEAEAEKLLSRNRTGLLLLLLLLQRGEAEEVGEEGTRLPARVLMPDLEMRQQTRPD